jgi:hypothetical protein
MNFLTNDQKATIARLAKQAYDAWDGREAFEDANPTFSRSKCFECWRRVEQGKAVGMQSLTQCTNDDFLPLIAHFQNFKGEGAAAMKTLLRHAEGPRITIFFKIQQALAERGLDEAWVAKICRCKFKCALGDASEKQLWNLFYDIKRSRKALPKPAQFRAPKRIKENLGTLSAGTAQLKGKVKDEVRSSGSDLNSKLQLKLARAVAEERYEDAATLRDQLAAITAPDPF